MLIDIDIKIADNDGKLVHHFEKRLDDGDTDCLEKLNNNYFGESFEDFLSEYMSFSGRQVKEKLNPGISTSMHLIPCSTFEGTGTFKSGSVYNLENSEIEYKIRIGNKNIFIGKMPLTQTSIATEPNNIPIKPENKSKDTTSLDQELVSLDNMINYAMLKAIEKYEANLYPISMDEEYACQESELSESNG